MTKKSNMTETGQAHLHGMRSAGKLGMSRVTWRSKPKGVLTSGCLGAQWRSTRGVKSSANYHGKNLILFVPLVPHLPTRLFI